MKFLKTLFSQSFLWPFADENTKNISYGPEIGQFKKLCRAPYRFYRQEKNLRLEKILVVFRHGERAPLANIGPKWREWDCVTCEDKCKNVKCTDGLLTKAGYKQARELGVYIRRYYIPLIVNDKLDPEDVYFRSTNTSRTIATLSGVSLGMTNKERFTEFKIMEKGDDTLRKPIGCIVKNHTKQGAQTSTLEKTLEEYGNTGNHSDLNDRIDQYITHMCAGVRIDCNDISCKDEAVTKHIKFSNERWKRNIGIILNEKNTQKKIFSGFASDLLEGLDNGKMVSLYSSHDSSISFILAGLGIDYTERPPYASAIFIEVWCKGGKQFIRIIFNSDHSKPREFMDDYIPIDDFKKYLTTMAGKTKKKPGPHENANQISNNNNNNVPKSM